MTDEERNSIINEAVNKSIEKMLLIMPETIGSLITSHIALNRINSKFYADYPEFKDKKNIVQSVVEMIEDKNPLAKYEDILIEAIPKIRERINIMLGLDMKTVTTTPNREFRSLENIISPWKPGNGEV